MQIWCERWNIKMNEDKIQGIYFLAVVDRLRTILYWMDETFHL
jgi:hypothetical protein